MTITKLQKDVVDYLWDWAEVQGEWAKLLVCLVCKKEDSLSETERKTIFENFLASMSGAPSQKIDSRPSFDKSFSVIRLKSLGDITGVNRLAQNQMICFADNLTVLYGGNGSGKTGYSRILKDLGYSYGNKVSILSNVLETKKTTAKSARIEYTVDEKTDCFIWNGNNVCDDIAKLTVFDSGCVNISLNDKRSLVVTPMGFHLFSLVSNELDCFSKMLTKEVSSISVEIPWLVNLHEGTDRKSVV